MMAKRQLILGSSSVPRAQLLERLQLPFTIVSPDIDETQRPLESPVAMVERLAIEKGEAIAARFPEALIISADQVGVLNGHVMGKPLTRDNAIKQLREASGNTIQFYIGLCLTDAKLKTRQIAVEYFDVVYRPLTVALIEKYLKKEEPLQCAGSCKAEGLGIALIQEFRGTDFTALIGLPLIRLVGMLQAAGLDPLDA